MKLPRSFYAQDDVTRVARALLGKTLCSNIEGKFTSGIIVETEAYRGRQDRGCHACLHGLTERTRVMFGPPGFSYVYLCYGIHHMFNVVTNTEGMADAVLIRAIEPFEGIEWQLARRHQNKVRRNTAGGPGLVCQALGIQTRAHYGVDLLGDLLWIEDRSHYPHAEVIASPRVGLGSAGDDARLPWRFRIQESAFTSPAS
jgi:DNA-3-methyladenine glycosylase